MTNPMDFIKTAHAAGTIDSSVPDAAISYYHARIRERAGILAANEYAAEKGVTNLRTNTETFTVTLVVVTDLNALVDAIKFIERDAYQRGYHDADDQDRLLSFGRDY